MGRQAMILHMDMDAFFASVEQLDNPELRGKPVIIGGHSSRGVVSTASYEARTFGVHSAMPIFQAKKNCPHGLYIRPRMWRYSELSRRIMGMLKGFSPLVEPVSIDEAYVDISGCGRLYGSPLEIARAIKARIREETGLTASVGIAPIKFLSKIASDYRKPDGITIIPPERVMEFIDQLPVEKVPGVGKSAMGAVRMLHIRTLGDVRRYPEAELLKRFGKFGRRLHELSRGIDGGRVVTESEVKSISGEETLSHDTDDRDLLRACLLKHSEDVGRELRKKGMSAKTIGIKVKFSDFKQITRSRTLKAPTHSSERIYREAARLFEEAGINRKIRLLGVRAASLVPEGKPAQMSLFGGGKRGGENWDSVDKAMDSIKGKFGKGAVTKATLTPKKPLS